MCELQLCLNIYLPLQKHHFSSMKILVCVALANKFLWDVARGFTLIPSSDLRWKISVMNLNDNVNSVQQKPTQYPLDGCKATSGPLSKCPPSQLPFSFPGSVIDGQNQSISWIRHKIDVLQRELQVSGRVEHGKRKGDREQNGEGGKLGETSVTRNRETLESSGKIQNCLGMISSFLTFLSLSFDTLPLWWHHFLPHQQFQSLGSLGQKIPSEKKFNKRKPPLQSTSPS